MAAASSPGTAYGSQLGDRIAERLCYPPSTHQISLSPSDADAFGRAARLSGDYRDIQGPEARAWFEKSPAGAICRTPADTRHTLFFCAAVSRNGDILTKDRPRLCP